MPRPIDPEKVAKLNQSDYAAIVKFSELVSNGRNQESDIPDDLYSTAFLAIRKCGSKVSFWSDMIVAAIQIQSQKTIIQKLRKHFGMS
tara:strand:- start:1418 stop:1681 length:264 start_codon:yes stop_codon:yes gene_type:complete